MKDNVICDILTPSQPTSSTEGLDQLLDNLDCIYPDSISEEDFDLLFKELEEQHPPSSDETRLFLFKDDCRIFYAWAKKLQRQAIRKKYVSGLDYKPKYQIKEEALDLAHSFLTELAYKNKLGGYCEERRFNYVKHTMFSQWMTQQRQKLGKLADCRTDKRNKTLRDIKKGEDSYQTPTPHSYASVEVEEGVFEKELYDPCQTTAEEELNLKTLIESMEDIVKKSCLGDDEKYAIWSELLDAFIQDKVCNIKKHSDSEWADLFGIPLKDLRKHKAQMKKALRENLSM